MLSTTRSQPRRPPPSFCREGAGPSIRFPGLGSSAAVRIVPSRDAPVKVRLVSASYFSAAHRLHRDDWDEERTGACSTSATTRTATGTPTDSRSPSKERSIPRRATSWTSGAQEAVKEHVIRRLDRRHLNFDVDFLSGRNPTAENIVIGIWRAARAPRRAGPPRPDRAERDREEPGRLRRRALTDSNPQKRLTRSKQQDDRGGLRRPCRVLLTWTRP